MFIVAHYPSGEKWQEIKWSVDFCDVVIKTFEKCEWKTGSGGWCCWPLLPTTVMLGFRAAGEQEVCLARTKEVNYYLLGTHSVWNLLSAIDTLVQGKGM